VTRENCFRRRTLLCARGGPPCATRRTSRGERRIAPASRFHARLSIEPGQLSPINQFLEPEAPERRLEFQAVRCLPIHIALTLPLLAAKPNLSRS
jgi:hypothetical protein